MKSGQNATEHICSVTSLAVLVTLTVVAFTSGCWSQDAVLSDRALREIGFDSTEVLRTIVLWNDDGMNSITEVNTENSSYLVTVRNRVHRGYLSGTVSGDLVISERVEEINGPWEDNLSELHARAVLIDSLGNKKQLWEVTEEADAGTLFEERWDLPYYVTAEYGCCDMRTLYKAHSLSTGETVMRYHSNLYRYWEGHYLAFSKEEPPDPVNNDDSLFVGILYMANENAVLHALKVRAIEQTVINGVGAEPYYWDWTVEMTWSDQVPGLQKDALCVGAGPIICTSSGYLSPKENIVARVLDDGPILIIPIKDDDFVLDQTKVNGYELIRLK